MIEGVTAKMASEATEKTASKEGVFQGQSLDGIVKQDEFTNGKTDLPDFLAREGEQNNSKETNVESIDKLTDHIDGLSSNIETVQKESKFPNFLDESMKQNNEFGKDNELKEKVCELTGWSDEIADYIDSLDEADIYMKADLKEAENNGKKCLMKKGIELDQKDEDGITNKEKLERGKAPITINGDGIELHHIGQKQNSPLAELTMEEHRGVGNDVILHDKTKETEIDRGKFDKERQEYWKSRLDLMKGVN